MAALLRPLSPSLDTSDLVFSLTSCLYSTGQLISSLLNLSIYRVSYRSLTYYYTTSFHRLIQVEALFTTIETIDIPSSQKSQRLLEITNIINESIRQISFGGEEAGNDSLLLKSTLLKVCFIFFVVSF